MLQLNLVLAVVTVISRCSLCDCLEKRALMTVLWVRLRLFVGY